MRGEGKQRNGEGRGVEEGRKRLYKKERGRKERGGIGEEGRMKG